MRLSVCNDHFDKALGEDIALFAFSSQKQSLVLKPALFFGKEILFLFSKTALSERSLKQPFNHACVSG